MSLLATEMRQNDKITCILEDRERRDRKTLSRATNDFQQSFQRPETRREFDLSDPLSLKKALPARQSDNDIRNTISGMQKFMGEDLNFRERKKFQEEQNREWSLQQQREWERARAHQKCAGKGERRTGSVIPTSQSPRGPGAVHPPEVHSHMLLWHVGKERRSLSPTGQPCIRAPVGAGARITQSWPLPPLCAQCLEDGWEHVGPRSPLSAVWKSEGPMGTQLQPVVTHRTRTPQAKAESCLPQGTATAQVLLSGRLRATCSSSSPPPAV